MKLNPKTYSLKKAKLDLERCNEVIIKETQNYLILKKTLDSFKIRISNEVEKKMYIKSILQKKRTILKKSRTKRRIDRMLEL